MGKIRHSKRPAVATATPTETIEVSRMKWDFVFSTSSPFQDVEFDLDDNDDDDKRSVVSNKTIKSLVAKKKDKIQLKRQFLLKRSLILVD